MSFYANVMNLLGYPAEAGFSSTKAIRNLGNMLILKFLESNKINSKLKVNRFKIPNYAYSNRYQQAKKTEAMKNLIQMEKRNCHHTKTKEWLPRPISNASQPHTCFLADTHFIHL